MGSRKLNFTINGIKKIELIEWIGLIELILLIELIGLNKKLLFDAS